MNAHAIRILLPALTVLIAYAGCTDNGQGSAGNAPINVEVRRVVPADSRHAFAYSGTIEESESIPLSFPVVGIVARVFVAEGDPVKKGDPLATLHDESYRSACDMAQASQKQAEDAYHRLLPMYRNGNLPEVKMVEVEANLERARSATVIAQKNLADCVLRSPADGLVGRRSVEPGMSALPNVTSITLVKIGTVYARIAVSEREISSMRKGEKAVITIAALNDARFSGTVQELGVVADPLVHTYKVRILVSNSRLTIKPGMICNVNIEQPASSHSLMVPGPAVMVDESSRAYVYAVDTSRGRATRRYVTTGGLLLDGIEITGGLAPDVLVVVAGQHKLFDGAPVRMINN